MAYGMDVPNEIEELLSLVQVPTGLSKECYMPIGCVRLLNSTILHNNYQAQASRLPLDGTELSKIFTFDLASDVYTLSAAAWIIAEPLDVALAPIRLWRISILPHDVACSDIDRTNKRLQKCLTNVLMSVETSLSKWNHGLAGIGGERFDMFAAADHASLYYLFNTLPSPAPTPASMRNPYNKLAAKLLLDDNQHVPGLLSRLHPYQRRSAAMMMQREVAPGMQLDPRLEEREGPDGMYYFYGARDRSFFCQPRMYDNVRGGILAETMGLGKTLICIALILATKDHLPAIPPQYAAPTSERRGPASLFAMASRAAIHHRIPWKSHFEHLSDAHGEEHLACTRALHQQCTAYEIPPRVVRSNRSTTYVGPPTKMLRCAGTIIVVPRNLVHQWQAELTKHVMNGILNVLIMDNSHKKLPPPLELITYDIVLFSRPRFELENKQVSPVRTLLRSPLSKIHWLRIIVDEGHGFSSMSTSTNAAIVAEKLLKVERRWIVSGTPAKDLLGVEVELPALTSVGAQDDYRKRALKQRMYFDASQERSSGAITAIGALMSRFLQVQPWTSAHSDGFDKSATWDDYVFRHEDVKARTYKCFSTCLRRSLTSVVVKTQPQDVERDLKLPPLTHATVRLEPSVNDKMTVNLFVLLFTANAITSERSDQDYLFHKNSIAHLHRLIANLRQSTFSWTAFDEASVTKSIETAEKYLAKDNTICSKNDRRLMQKTIDIARVALRSPVWKGLSRTHEVGLVTEHWPADFCNGWAFDDCSKPMTTGLSLALNAQRYVNDRLSNDSPLDGFGGAGVKAKLLSIVESEADQSHSQKATDAAPITGVPAAGLQSETMGLKRLSASGATRTSPKKNKASPASPANTPKSKKRKLSFGDTNIELSSDSDLGKTRLIGTTSSKLTYLIDRVSEIHSKEKILIFYDGGNIAYYLSQAFDLLNIKHLIYANTLSGEQRSKYIVLFDTDANQRVLIMDIKQAAHGLNLSSASRVFFVNPPCRPDIEAQAIKRAHRIGQTKPVHVETLVLSGTVEEAMHDRAAKMTSREHLAAKTLEDDEGIRGIIQNAGVLPVYEHRMLGKDAMAPLKHPQQLFGRPGRGAKNASVLEKELFEEKAVDQQDEAAPKKRRMVVKKADKRTTKHSNDAHVDQPQVEQPVVNSIFGG
ncbi:MAG: hypothetical protein M1828_007193 [Chrysothrix sp. TS-e1954]|nr:MAG: hypothetical protein M1828_007193 [Chrysothrix sp. TS-e1954]